jgi:RND family efflux transporter MFP subunit
MQQLQWMTVLPKKKLYYVLVAIIALMMCILGGIVWKGNHQGKKVAEDIPLVRTVKIGPATAASIDTYSGEVKGRYESQLGFPVNNATPYNGIITKRYVDVGNVVEPGEILMQMSAADLRQNANAYSAQVYSAESQFKLAEKNLDRYRQLYSQGAVSRATLDQYKSAYDVAEAGVRQSKALYNQSSNQINASTIYADTAGVISAINAEVGQIVSAGQPIITVVHGAKEVEINVPENMREELKKVQQIRVTFWALPKCAVKGRIREIAPVADKITRTYQVRIRLMNPPPEVHLGMTATVKLIRTKMQSSIFIPLSAVYQEGADSSVWVVNNGIVNLQPVTLGTFGDDNNILVLEGLKAGETVVTAGVQKLWEGQKVRLATGDGQ